MAESTAATRVPLIVGKRLADVTEDVCRPLDAAHLLHVEQVGRQAAVHAEDLLVDDGGDR